MRLPRASGARLKRMASRHGWTPSDTSARLVEEGLRRAEFAYVDFRDFVTGRQACIQGSSLTVWEVIWLLQSSRGSIAKTAKHLEWPEDKVRAAINYHVAFPQEIDLALAEQNAMDFKSLSCLLPQIEEFPVSRRRR